jgi:RimJ/RimL family protein N-acetyltransferase
MKYNSIIEGEEICLKSIELTDCTEQYVHWLNDTETNKYLESRLSVQTIESVARFVLDIIESKDSYMFAIIHRKKKEHIGNIKIGPIHPIYRNAFAGYLIGVKSCWGKGFASEAVYLAAKFGFDTLGLHKINAGVIAPNIGSIKVLEKLGFKKEACIRDDVFQDGSFYDVYRYGVLRIELTPPPPPRLGTK